MSEELNLLQHLRPSLCVCYWLAWKHMIDRLTPPPGILLKGNKETTASEQEGLEQKEEAKVAGGERVC